MKKMDSIPTLIAIREQHSYNFKNFLSLQFPLTGKSGYHRQSRPMITTMLPNAPSQTCSKVYISGNITSPLRPAI